jgi:hypothetical protein
MIRNRLARVLKRGVSKPIVKNDDGVTAIEFAMIAPVFFLLMGSLMETGIMLFTEYVMQTSVQEAARLVRTGQAHTNGLSESDFKQQICETASIISNCESNVTVHLVAASSFDALTDIVPSPLSVGSTYGAPGSPNDNFDCGSPSEAVALIATFDWKFTMPFLQRHFGNVDGDSKRRLSGVYMFQNEPFPTGSSCG